MSPQGRTMERRQWKVIKQTGIGVFLLILVSSLLVACGQGQGSLNEPGEADVSAELSDVGAEAGDVAQEAGDVAQEAGEEVAEAGQAVGQAAQQGAEAVEEAAEQAGEEIGEAAEQAGQEISEEAQEVQAEVVDVLPQEIVDVPGVTLSELDDQRDQYLDETVAVRGDITESIGAYVFRLDDPALLGGDDILVIRPSENADVPMAEGNTIEVAGLVRAFDIPALEEETGFDLEDNLFDELDGDETVLIAQKIVDVADQE